MLLLVLNDTVDMRENLELYPYIAVLLSTILLPVAYAE